MNILFNEKCLQYNMNNHIEGSYRIEAFVNKFSNTGCKDSGEEYIKSLYASEYVEKIKEKFSNGEYIAEVNTTKLMYEAACISADLAVKASIQNAFAITRPPGHHASTNNAEGFCIFNNIAVATNRLVEKNKKVCIVDIDGHHGNGTEDIFKDNPKVLYCSLHQENTYPFRGFLQDTHSLNFPLTPGCGDDIFMNTVTLFKKMINNFQPDFIAISAGFDGYHKDALLNLNFTKRGYYEVGRILNNTDAKIFCCLEGGYHKEIVECTKELINGLTKKEYISKEKLSKSNDNILDNYQKREIIFKKTHGLF